MTSARVPALTRPSHLVQCCALTNEMPIHLVFQSVLCAVPEVQQSHAHRPNQQQAVHVPSQGWMQLATCVLSTLSTHTSC